LRLHILQIVEAGLARGVASVGFIASFLRGLEELGGVVLVRGVLDVGAVGLEERHALVVSEVEAVQNADDQNEDQNGQNPEPPEIGGNLSAASIWWGVSLEPLSGGESAANGVGGRGVPNARHEGGDGHALLACGEVDVGRALIGVAAQ